FVFFFFFSSRRRHTRWPRDWSSDVCSSDLTLSSDTVWRKTHRTGGFTFVIAGGVMITAAFVSGALVWVLLAAAAVLAVAVPVVQSYVLWRREQHEKP